MVLLKKGFLPLKGKVNLFGRNQFHYYKSGTGSGGLVNTEKVYSLYDILSNSPLIEINDVLANTYQSFIEAHPHNHGNGTWASEPWSQQEMLISEADIIQAKSFSDVGIIVIGRTAGEDKDFTNTRGSFKLSLEELELIKRVRKHLDKVLLILNVGTIIDINEVVDDVDAILLAYHGGYYGAISIYEAITGITSPTGSLPFTILKDIKQDITYDDFAQVKTIYQEDIYVGYRYHHTFKENNILFPLGFSENYSTFAIENIEINIEKAIVKAQFKIRNTGDYKSNKTLFFYLEQPSGLLGKPKYVLAHFYKPQPLNPGESVFVETSFDLYHIASYDDVGVIEKDSIVLEKGEYTLHIGYHIGDRQYSHPFHYEKDMYFGYYHPLPLKQPFKRLVYKDKAINYELTPIEHVKTFDCEQGQYVENNMLFNEVKTFKDLKTFVQSLTDEDLMHLIKGEGMSSPKVTPGIAGAVGGITESLKNKQIPIIGLADGPSGIRMDSGFFASSIPNSTLLASTFNLEKVEQLYTLVGYEMDHYNIDVLLAPGMNLQRNVLCGRNFEYFSEDPLITGYLASSVVKGLHQANKFGSLKHYAANNQETKRFENEVWVSNRAFRELYHKGFEYAIMTANAKVIMSSYNYINGYHSASHPTLYHTIKQEGFQGIIISDWWAHLNDVDQPLNKKALSKMVLANHDIYMVVGDTTTFDSDLDVALEKGLITRGHLEQLAINILHFLYTHKSNQKQPNIDAIIKSDYQKGVIEGPIDKNIRKKAQYSTFNNAVLMEDYPIHFIPTQHSTIAIDTPTMEVFNIEPNPYVKTRLLDDEAEKDNYHFRLQITHPGKYIFIFTLENHNLALSQSSFNMYFNQVYEQTFSYQHFEGTLNASAFKILDIGEVVFSIKMNQMGLKIKQLHIQRHP